MKNNYHYLLNSIQNDTKQIHLIFLEVFLKLITLVSFFD